MRTQARIGIAYCLVVFIIRRCQSEDIASDDFRRLQDVGMYEDPSSCARERLLGFLETDDECPPGYGHLSDAGRFLKIDEGPESSVECRQSRKPDPPVPMWISSTEEVPGVCELACGHCLAASRCKQGTSKFVAQAAGV